MQINLQNLCTIATGKLDVNAHNPKGSYPFFTCARENYNIDVFAFDGESVLVAGNGDLNVKYYNGKFNAYQRTYVLQDFVYNGKYLFYVVSNNLEQLRSGSRGSTIKYIRLGDLENILIPLVSLPHQTLIVDEIEKQLSRLESGLVSLQKLQTLAKQYRASVLSSAVSGKLVSQDIIFKQSQKEESQSDIFPDNVKSILFDLPKDRIWEKPIKICNLVIDCHNKTAPYKEKGIMLIRTTNVRNGKINLEETKFVDQKTYEFRSKRGFPQTGDIIFTREAPMGESGIIPQGVKLCMGQRMMLMRVNESIILNKYLHYVLISPLLENYINTVAIGTGVKHLRVKDVENIPIPLPPLSEQQRIVEEVERRFSVLDKLEQTITENITRAQQLKQSILHQAFSGQLVDYDDDPAEIEALIAQIEQAKEDMKKIVRKKK